MRKLLFKLLFVFALLWICTLTHADPIHDAATNGDLAAVQRLVNGDAKLVNARAPNGATPLLWAAIRGQEQVARFLIAHGADVNIAQGDGWTPLHAAVCDGNDAAHAAIARLLVEHGAKLEAQNGIGWTPLHGAALKGNTATIGVLLENKANIEAKDNTGSTPLHIAAEQGQIEAVKLLQDNGADVAAKNKQGKTPAERALARGQMPVVERLLAGMRVTLSFENIPFAEALQQLFAAAKMPQTVSCTLKTTVTLNLTNVPFALALKTIAQSADGSLTYRLDNNILMVSQGASQGSTAAGKETSQEASTDAVVSSDPRYRFYKTISRATLNNYLSRAVTHYGLCSTSPEPETPCFDDDLRMLTGIGAKFIGRAAYAWVPPDDEEAHFRLAAERARRVHQADSDIVLQAAVFEAVYENVNKIPVPEWVFTEFRLPIEKRAFRYAAMLYDNKELHDHWTQGASVPDMSKLETRLYFYYRARRYIDCGFEAIHFGQVHLMDHKDPDHRYWQDMLTRVRRYAFQHARRGIALCDAHTHGDQANGRLLFNFHSWPQRPREQAGDQSSALSARLQEGYGDSIYGQSLGGLTPSGWSCDALPYLVEFDQFGASGKEGKFGAGFPWVWGYDEGDWFTHASPSSRQKYLAYAWNWVRSHNGWLQMPTRLNLSVPIEGVKMWQANTRGKACPVGFDLEETIKAIWNTTTRTLTQ